MASLNRARLLLIFLFLLIPALSFSQNSTFSNYTGTAYKNPLVREFSSPKYGVVKRGGYVTFSVYSGTEVHRKNMLTHLKPQFPVIITGDSPDAPFVFVDAGIVKGWMRADNVIVIAKEAFDGRISSPVVILKKDITFNKIFYPIATMLALREDKKKRYMVSIFDDNGNPVHVDIKKELATPPVEPTRANLNKTASLFKKKPYVWANSDKGWDCSGLLMDYFSFFGVQIPRNSYQQINFSQKINVSTFSLKQKGEILKKSKPYLTLLYFPGHIMLYTGKSGKEYMSFQAVNRVGKRIYGRVGFFPLIKTGLLKRVTEIGYIDAASPGNLTNLFSGSKL